MSAETLQEFLVRVRYESDQASQNNMLSGISNIGTSVMKLGATVLAAGSAVAYATLKYADNMNSLYLSSQRLGMGIKDINSMSKAAAELGSSVESAKSSFEAFASFQRHNPFGSVDLMRSMGADVSLEDTNDIKLKKLSDAMQRTIASRGNVAGTQMNLIQGQILGLSENDLLAMMNPNYKKTVAKLDKAQEVENYKQAAEKSHAGIIAKDIAEMHFDSNMSRLMIPAIETGTKFLDVFSENIDKSAKSAIDLEKSFIGLSDAVTESIVNLRVGGEKDLTVGEIPSVIKEDFKTGVSGIWNNIKSALSNPLVKKRNEIVNGLMERGAPEAIAIGMAANVQAENAGFDPKKQQIGGGGGYGLAQWDKERQDNYKKWNKGVSMQDTPNSEATGRQLDFMLYELSTYKNNALKAMQRAGSNVINVSSAATRLYETPKDMDGEIARRGKNAQMIMIERHPELQSPAQATNNTTIHVHGVSNPNEVVALIDRKTRANNTMQARNSSGAFR